MTRIATEFLEVALREFGEAVAKEDTELADAWMEVAFRLNRQDREDAEA
jgi:hypothetical protein